MPHEYQFAQHDIGRLSPFYLFKRGSLSDYCAAATGRKYSASLDREP